MIIHRKSGYKMHYFLMFMIVISYLIYIFYDWCNVNNVRFGGKDQLFMIATGILTFVTIGYIILSFRHRYGFRSVFFMIIAACALVLMIKAIFFSLPKGTYTAPGKRRKVYTRGLYALCRHPGVLFYCIFYIFLWLAMPSAFGLIECLLFCIGNIAYMLVQDIWSFPRIFIDYDRYKQRTPMLIPNRRSIRRCIKTF